MTDRDLVAYHEAGHTVIALWLGYTVPLVSTIKGPGRGGFAECRPPSDRPALEATIDAILVDMAGEAAEILAPPESRYVPESDDEPAIERAVADSLARLNPQDRMFALGAERSPSDTAKAEQASESVPEAPLFRLWLRTRAHNLVVEHAAPIRALAAQLLRTPVMDGAAIAAVVYGDSPAAQQKEQNNA